MFGPPAVVRLENRSGTPRLHCLDGPAVDWPDGFRLYRVAGVPIEPELVQRPELITRDRIFQERNAEVRKALIQRIGSDRFLRMARAKVIDQDVDASGMPRRLFRVRAGGGKPWCVVEVECPSKRDKHYLWVPPEMERCSQAVAWTFGFEAPG